MNKSKTNFKNIPSADYQAKLAAPFAVLGLRIEEDWLTDVEYLPAGYAYTGAADCPCERDMRSITSVSG